MIQETIDIYIIWNLERVEDDEEEMKGGLGWRSFINPLGKRVRCARMSSVVSPFFFFHQTNETRGIRVFLFQSLRLGIKNVIEDTIEETKFRSRRGGKRRNRTDSNRIDENSASHSLLRLL